MKAEEWDAAVDATVCCQDLHIGTAVSLADAKDIVAVHNAALRRAVAAEREACAQLVEDMIPLGPSVQAFADAIRVRRQVEVE